jgi:hypothetical protein
MREIHKKITAFDWAEWQQFDSAKQDSRLVNIIYTVTATIRNEADLGSRSVIS